MGPAELPVDKDAAPGYMGVALGTWAGGVAGGALGLAVMTRGVEAAGPALLWITFLTFFVGAVGGAWCGLKLVADPALGRTTFMVGAGVLAWAVVSVPSIFWALERWPRERPQVYLAYLGFVAMLTLPPAVAARALVAHSDKIAEREETSN